MVKNALKLKDTGIYRDVKGEINLKNGIAYIKNLQLAGPSMSLYINGQYNILDDTAILLILGRVSDDIVKTLGPLAKETNDYTYIPKINNSASLFISDITASDIENTANIPDLTVKTQFKTQEFKVLFNGKIDKQTSVQSFKWIKRQEDNFEDNNNLL